MRACRARTACLLPLLFPFSMLGHAPVTARASRCEKAAAFAGEHRNPPRLAVCGKTGKFEVLPFRYGALC